jgi:shikimate kinase
MVANFVLIGPPGAGKTSVAKTLARKRGSKFVDTDSLIEARTGKRISEIFLDDGEERFREIERDVVLETLRGENEIVALGGGSVLNDEVQSVLETLPHVIFLDVSLSNAAPRVGFNRERPLLLGNPRAQWVSLMEKRRPIYERLAKISVSTDNKKPDEVAEEILEQVGI